MGVGLPGMIATTPRRRAQAATRLGPRPPWGLSGRARRAGQLAVLPADQQHAGVEDRRVGPAVMPISSASTKVRIVTPPNSSSATSVRRTVSDVFSERPSVCVRLWLTTSSNGSPAWRTEVLADAVEDHDRVVDREADDRQHGRDEQRVELDRRRGGPGSRRCRARAAHRGRAPATAQTP